MNTARLRTFLLSLGIVAVCGGAIVAAASGAMSSEKLGRNLCLTTGGGKFVDIPGFPGERIDRRLVSDIRMLKRKYKIFITDGYSHDPVHAANGEHPLGLALDIVPNAAKGGTWKDISRLARWAEPSQNQPRAPFRWVGYNGDAGHGRGHHLHLSWNHSESRPFHPARSVYSLRCPGERRSRDGGGGRDEGGKRDGDGRDGGRGGVRPGRGDGGGGGISPKVAADLERQLRHPVAETGGVGLR
jgi:hypothetical protein